MSLSHQHNKRTPQSRSYGLYLLIRHCWIVEYMIFHHRYCERDVLLPHYCGM